MSGAMKAESRARRQVWIISGPLSMKTLVVWGVIIFPVGFFSRRQMRDASETAAVQSIPAAAPASHGESNKRFERRACHDSITDVFAR